MTGDTQSPIRIRAGQTNLYLLIIQEGLLLVDAGPRGSLKHLQRGLDTHRLRLEDIRLIVLTHTHYDHVGGLREISGRTRARVLVHEAEANFLSRGFTPFPRGTGPFSKTLSLIGRTVARRAGRYPAVFPHVVVDQSLDLGPYGLRGHIVPTPGHSPGSLSILLDAGAAVVGDTLFHFPPWRIAPPFADDPSALAESWKLLFNSGCQTFYPAHGGPVTRELFERRAGGRAEAEKRG